MGKKRIRSLEGPAPKKTTKKKKGSLKCRRGDLPAESKKKKKWQETVNSRHHPCTSNYLLLRRKKGDRERSGKELFEVRGRPATKDKHEKKGLQGTRLPTVSEKRTNTVNGNVKDSPSHRAGKGSQVHQKCHTKGSGVGDGKGKNWINSLPENRSWLRASKKLLPPAAPREVSHGASKTLRQRKHWKKKVSFFLHLEKTNGIKTLESA